MIKKEQIGVQFAEKFTLLVSMDVTDIFKVPDQLIKAKAGRLLISEPFMQDPYFKRSVVLLTEHSDSGSFGLIVNKPIPMFLNEAVDNAPVFNARLGLGGPVQKDTLHYLHRVGHLVPNSTEVMPGVFWGGDFEVVKKLITSEQLKPKDIRMFVGYAGWAEGQLTSEMNSKSWIVAKADESILFDEEPDKLWSKLLAQMGEPYAYMVNLPEDPRLN